MKKKFKILLFSLSVIVFMASFTFKKAENGILGGTTYHPVTDTSLARQWIRIDSFNLSILPPSSGVQFYRDGIVFLSSSKFADKMVGNHISFGNPDARYATLKENQVENQRAFSVNTAFSYPCEAVTFTSDYNTMFFTRYSKKEGVEKIYRATYKSGDIKEGYWFLDDNPMSFCSDKFSYSHPALSADGKLMIFASNRAGSIGGMDLYASIEKGGVWSEPVNLGDAVNSTANELYPYLDGDNNLYFSSDGAQGYGGYDIYVCKFKSKTWEKPINLSSPINSRFDDVAFTINRKDGKSGFYTVKENSGKRSQQLYMVSMSDSRPDSLLSLSQFFTRPDMSQMVILVLEPPVQATDKATETASVSRSEKDIITYRVQFMTSFNPRTRTQINVSGIEYPVFEYLFSGAYRLCIGEFSSLSQAVELQNAIRKIDYPQATVVAFKNNVLSLDPALLKEQPGTNKLAASDQKKPAENAVVATTGQTVTGTINKDKPVTDVSKTETGKVVVPVTETKKPESVKTIVQEPSEKKDVVVYRVQILTSNASKGKYKVTVASKSYDAFEYQYAGAYRTCVGEFNTLSSATELQKVCRQSGYPQAFVVAFKNNVRSTDPALFK